MKVFTIKTIKVRKFYWQVYGGFFNPFKWFRITVGFRHFVNGKEFDLNRQTFIKH